MSTRPKSADRTRAFARVIGPFLVIVPAIVAVRAPEMGPFASSFFDNPALVWIIGGLLPFAGLVVIVNHQDWSSVAGRPRKGRFAIRWRWARWR